LLQMSGKNSSRAKERRVEAEDPRLRYHLTSLYTLRPIPADLLQLVHELGKRVSTARPAND
jgi:hypothetical protein